MPKFIPYDYNQSSMIVINYQDQLQPGTFEHAIHHLVDKRIDLSIFIPIIIMMMSADPLMTPRYY